MKSITPPSERSNVVGEGTYGCVHRPSLKCNKSPKNIDYNNKISKIGKKQNINEEITEYKTIDAIDKKAFFYPGKPKNCLPLKDADTIAAIDECKDFKGADIKKYKLLIMTDGGEDLEKFSTEIERRLIYDPSLEPELQQKMELFWIEAHRMFLGVLKFIKSGVVHHDLKSRNIVFNQSKNRINFIDFGLMTTMDNIKTESDKSNYGFAIRHWSFPPETKIYNYNKYLKLEENKQKQSEKKNKFILESEKQKEYNYFLGELKSANSNINIFFEVTIPEFKDEKHNSVIVKDHVKQYNQMIFNEIVPDSYDKFIDKSIRTIDSYGLAIGLIFVLNKTMNLIPSQFAIELKSLFLNMMNFNVWERITIDDAISRYEDILENNGLLRKYNVHFENHEIKTNTEIYKKIDQTLKSIVIPPVKISMKKMEEDPKTRCPINTSYNKHKKRCLSSKKLNSRSTSIKSKSKIKNTKKRVKITK